MNSLAWREDVAALLEVADGGDPALAADRLTELVVATGAWPGSADRCLASIRLALGSTTPVAVLAPRPTSEGACRKLLGLLAARLEDWIGHGSGAVPEPLDAWRPGAAAPRPVALLDREHEHLARWLGVRFEPVDDDLGQHQMAVLRLRSGRLVALVRFAGSRAGGVSLLQLGSRPSGEVLEEFLADTRLPPSVVGRRLG